MSNASNPNGHAGALTSTMKDYLKVIFDLNQNKSVVRVKDIAKKLDVKMPTVTNMLKKLDQRGLVKHKKYEYVELREKGVCFAREMGRRNRILSRFLRDILFIEKKTAAEEACKMEHVLSPRTLDTLVRFMDFVESGPKTGETWPIRFKAFQAKRVQARTFVANPGPVRAGRSGICPPGSKKTLFLEGGMVHTEKYQGSGSFFKL